MFVETAVSSLEVSSSATAVSSLEVSFDFDTSFSFSFWDSEVTSLSSTEVSSIVTVSVCCYTLTILLRK